MSCIRRYNALMNRVIWISGVTVSTRAKALVLTVTPQMHINLFISALYLQMHSIHIILYIMFKASMVKLILSKSSTFHPWITTPSGRFSVPPNQNEGNLSHLQSWEKKLVNLSMQFIITSPMLTTAVDNGAWHCLIESRGVLAFTIILPSHHQINVGGSGKVSDNMNRINIALGEGGFFFPKSDKVSQQFFQDCR